MKKKLTMFAAMAMSCALLLTGCGGSGGEKNGDFCSGRQKTHYLHIHERVPH